MGNFGMVPRVTCRRGSHDALRGSRSGTEYYPGAGRQRRRIRGVGQGRRGVAPFANQNPLVGRVKSRNDRAIDVPVRGHSLNSDIRTTLRNGQEVGSENHCSRKHSKSQKASPAPAHHEEALGLPNEKVGI